MWSLAYPDALLDFINRFPRNMHSCGVPQGISHDQFFGHHDWNHPCFVLSLSKILLNSLGDDLYNFITALEVSLSFPLHF